MPARTNCLREIPWGTLRIVGCRHSQHGSPGNVRKTAGLKLPLETQTNPIPHTAITMWRSCPVGERPQCFVSGQHFPGPSLQTSRALLVLQRTDSSGFLRWKPSRNCLPVCLPGACSLGPVGRCDILQLLSTPYLACTGNSRCGLRDPRQPPTSSCPGQRLQLFLRPAYYNQVTMRRHHSPDFWRRVGLPH
jgi:hypothetical protein